MIGSSLNTSCLEIVSFCAAVYSPFIKTQGKICIAMHAYAQQMGVCFFLRDYFFRHPHIVNKKFEDHFRNHLATEEMSN